MFGTKPGRGDLNRYLICIMNLLCLTYTLSCGSPQTEPPIVRQRNTDTTVGLAPVPTLPGQAGAASVSSTFVATAGSHCGQGAHCRGQAAPTKGSGRGNQSSFPLFHFLEVVAAWCRCGIPGNIPESRCFEENKPKNVCCVDLWGEK